MTTINAGQDTKERLVASLTRAKSGSYTPQSKQGVRKPSCSTCHGGTVALRDLSRLWGYSSNQVYSFIEKGMPYHNGEYYNSHYRLWAKGRQGTHGITQRFVCLDEVELWAVKNRNMFRRRQPNAINGRYLPATWEPRINLLHGSFVEHAPVIADYHGLFDSPRITDGF